MTAPEQAAPAGLAARARQVRFATVLDTAVTGLLTGIGWVFGALWFGLVCAVLYCAAPLAWGFRAGARRPQPDEKAAPPPGGDSG